MFRSPITILFFFIVTPASSQGYVNRSKASSKKQFLKYAIANHLQTQASETDSTLSLLVRDTTVQHLDIVLHFNAQGKCDVETTTLACDSCYEKFLYVVLQNKDYKWIKVEPDTYFSKNHRLVLSARVNNAFSYSVRSSTLSRREYREILKKAT